MIGERLKRLRGKRTQDSIANYLGISRARYSHYENNRTEPDIEMLKKLANFYNISIDELLGNSLSTNTSSVDEILQLAKTAGIESSGFFDIEQWRNLAPEEFAQLVKYFEFIQMQSKEKGK